MFRSEDYSAAEEADNCIWMDPVSSKKRRFSEEQVKCLESMFESQTKLEPRKKLQLAKELGLHPRQVAIWFQNKRARRKSKQLEREYSALIADYDALLSSFESLKSEKQVLTKQSQKLAQLLDKPVVEQRGKDNDYNEIDERPSLPLAEKSDVRLKMCSDDEGNRYNKFTEKEADLCTEPAMTSSLVSAEQQFGFRPSWSSHQSCTTSQWWDFGL